MIIKLSILIILILGAFAFLGIKLSSSLKDLKFLFLVLYGVSIFTVCNIILSIYFFVSLRNKRGSPGPKGKTGPMGDKGIDGDCGSEGDEKEINCLKKSLVAIIIDTLETVLLSKYNEATTDDISRDANKKKFKPLQGFEKNAICSYVNEITWDVDNVSNIKTVLTNLDDLNELKKIIKEIIISAETDRKDDKINFLINKSGSVDGILRKIYDKTNVYSTANNPFSLTTDINTFLSNTKKLFETCSN